MRAFGEAGLARATPAAAETWDVNGTVAGIDASLTWFSVREAGELQEIFEVRSRRLKTSIHRKI